MVTYRTPLSRARGLGSAKHGVGHWIAERAAAVFLVPLVLWGVLAALRVAAMDYHGAVAWLHGSSFNAVLLLLLISVSVWHMQAGLRVVIDDYVHRPLTKIALLLGNFALCVLAGSLAIFCVLKVALGGGVP
jgi:succinate dehydrogenase / fumarate reductase membrane anchor subunit